MDITVDSSVANLSSNGTDATSRVHRLRSSLTWKAVYTGRLIFVACLLCVATVMGVVTWFFLRDSERRLAENQFEAIAERAINTAQEIVVRKRLGTISLSSVIANLFPFNDQWPFIAMQGYEEVAKNLIETSNGREMGLCPLVVESQLPQFENHAYEWFQERRVPVFPNGTGYSSFGEGIWMPNTTCDCADNRSHVTTTETSWGSDFDIVTPILQHNEGAHPALMLNLHFEPSRGRIIDDIMRCSGCTVSSETGEIDCLQAPPHPNPGICGAMTDMVILTSQEVEPGPGALLMEPIYPARNTSELVGVIASSIVWDESLRNVFSNDVSGVDCVLSSTEQTYTYGVNDGVPFVRGKGDLHDTSHEGLKQEIILTPGELFSNTSVIYKLELYPTDEFFETYETRNPRVATIGAVCIIAFMAGLFFLYDFCVRKEFDARKELLEAKRQFVRFVSHEVRTPLNTVCMGLTLMQEEMAVAMGLERSDLEELQHENFDSKTLPGEKAFDWLTLSHEVLVNAKASVDVLNDLLNYDKVQQGNLVLELSTFSLWTLLESTVGEFKLAALERRITLKLDFSPIAGQSSDQPSFKSEAVLPPKIGRMVVVGDTVRLSQVIRNLVSNALKFTRENGFLTVRVDVEHIEKKNVVEKQFNRKDGSYIALLREGVVWVEVIDTGVGMTAQQVSSVFADGTQFNANTLQAGKGSGLGMYIARGICKEHGGSLECSSEGLGHGTTFTMKIPLYSLPDSTDISLEKIAPTGGEENESKEFAAETLPLRVLAVDDTTSNLKLLQRLLVNRGHLCDGACNGKDAVKMVQDNVELYDTVLLDYEMPEMDGPTACAQMRRLGCSSFIVGITGNIMPEDVSHFKSCGANAVLPKPFKMTLLEELWTEYGVSGRSHDSDHSRRDATVRFEEEPR